MYNNPYYTSNLQLNVDKIDNQIKELENMRNQLQRNSNQPAINQTFQLAPTHNSIKYVSTLDDVKREIVYADTPFFSKDLTVVWVKNAKGDIKAFEMKEIIQKDEKDIQIDYLMEEIEKLKGMMKNEKHTTDDDRKDVQTSTSDGDETTGKQTKND